MKKIMYDKKFYLMHDADSYESAKIVVPILLTNFDIKSVVDIGCGSGAWLKVFHENNISEICGYDLSKLDETDYLIPSQFIQKGIDISSQKFSVSGEFDLLVCLEVVEHISPKSSFEFVKKITQISPIILFSAAIPGQTGRNHINEQTPSYWRKIFKSFDYIEVDFLRQLLWKNNRIAWWYRQNITIFANKNFIEKTPKLKELAKNYPQLHEEINLVLISERILNQYTKNPFLKLYIYFQNKIQKS